MEASSRHQGFIQKTFQNLDFFVRFSKKHVPKPLVFARFLPRMMENDGQLKNLQKPMVFDTFASKTLKNQGEKIDFCSSMAASSRHQGFIQKTFQNLGFFVRFSKKHVPKPLVFARFLPRMMENDGQLKNLQKPMVFDTFSSKTLRNPRGKKCFFQWKLRRGTKASSKKPSKT